MTNRKPRSPPAVPVTMVSVSIEALLLTDFLASFEYCARGQNKNDSHY